MLHYFFPQGSQAKLHSLTPAQKAYMSSLSQGLDTIESAEKDLGTPAQIPALGSDPVSPFYAYSGGDYWLIICNNCDWTLSYILYCESISEKTCSTGCILFEPCFHIMHPLLKSNSPLIISRESMELSVIVINSNEYSFKWRYDRCRKNWNLSNCKITPPASPQKRKFWDFNAIWIHCHCISAAVF